MGKEHGIKQLSMVLSMKDFAELIMEKNFYGKKTTSIKFSIL